MKAWISDDFTACVYNFILDYKAFSPDLYFHPEHLRAQASGRVFHFVLYRKNSPDPVASLVCTPGPGAEWTSPGKAPFGGIIFQNQCLNGGLAFFLRCICEFIASQGGLGLIIKAPAHCYDPFAQGILHGVYCTTGFRPVSTLANHYIFINKCGFKNRIHRMERRKLEKCFRASFKTALCDQISTKQIFNFLQSNYSRKGYQLSISESELACFRRLFPDQFPVFTITDKDEITAMIVSVRVRTDTLYVFLSAFRNDYRHFSPIVALMEKVYRFCQEENISILDLGTSLDHHGRPKAGLISFKERLGASVCDKITYQIRFDQISRQLPSR